MAEKVMQKLWQFGYQIGMQNADSSDIINNPNIIGKKKRFLSNRIIFYCILFWNTHCILHLKCNVWSPNFGFISWSFNQNLKMIIPPLGSSNLKHNQLNSALCFIRFPLTDNISKFLSSSQVSTQISNAAISPRTFSMVFYFYQNIAENRRKQCFVHPTECIFSPPNCISNEKWENIFDLFCTKS